MNAVTAPPKAETITLYYREGASDKVYQAAIEAAGELFVVNFTYGRRGSTLSTGTKNSSPVDYNTAKRTYDKLVRQKMAKGYSPCQGGTTLSSARWRLRPRTGSTRMFSSPH